MVNHPASVGLFPFTWKYNIIYAADSSQHLANTVTKGRHPLGPTAASQNSYNYRCTFARIVFWKNETKGEEMLK
jgi:hypothetical protein